MSDPRGRGASVARRRLFTAANGREATVLERDSINIIADGARAFMAAIVDLAPEGDDKEKALGLIEDALMRANRSFFNPESAPPV